MADAATMKTIEAIILFVLTVAYLPLHFIATKPPVKSLETVWQYQPEADSEEKPPQSSSWFREEEKPKPQKASSKWGTIPNAYCKKKGNTLPILLPNDYGFKPSSRERCKEECAKRPECTSFTYGQWNKKPEIFGVEIKFGPYYGQWRCQLYEICEQHVPEKEWGAVVSLFKKRFPFEYTPLPPEHDFRVISALALSVVMAINIVYVFSSTVGHKWGLGVITAASIVSAFDLRSYFEPASGISIIPLFGTYIVNCCVFVLMYSLEDNKIVAPSSGVGFGQSTSDLGMTIPPVRGDSHARFGKKNE